jgi:hypothetical protein
MPGRPPTMVGIPLAGLPGEVHVQVIDLDSVITSRPQNVKNTKHSMPDWRAALARMSDG